MSDNRRFEKYSAIYTCRICDRRTRETGDSESYVGLCADCYNLGGLDNELSDGCIEQDEFNRKARAILKGAHPATLAAWEGQVE